MQRICVLSCVRGLALAGLLAALVVPACKRKSTELVSDAGSELPSVLPFRDPTLSVEERVADLLGRLSIEEKIAQLQTASPAIPRLEIPAYDWRNEAPYGVARAGLATVFPHPIGLAATFDADLVRRVATAISDEARIKHHRFAAQGKHGSHRGLTFFGPSINLFRDPRWGRGMETFGEDPVLAGRLGAAFVRGMQGDDPRYLKTVATLKYFVVQGGPKAQYGVDALIGVRDLRESYLPQFEHAVVGARARSVMSTCNRINGEPACESPWLGDILRGEWRWDGYVVSDCGALAYLLKRDEAAKNGAEVAARALKAGIDLDCGDVYARHLPEAMAQGLVVEADIDRALTRLLRVRFSLGLFDPITRIPYAGLPYTEVAGDKHHALALEAARKSMVLLKNARGTLPLKKTMKRILVVGPVAIDPYVALGKYFDTSRRMGRILEAIRAKLPAAEVDFSLGSSVAEGLPALRLIPPMGYLHVDEENAQHVPGLKVEYFNNLEREGSPALSRVEPAVDKAWGDEAPDPYVREDGFSVRFSGLLVPERSGRHLIGVRSDCGYIVKLGGATLEHQEGDPEKPWLRTFPLDLQAGKPIPLLVEAWDHAGEASIQLYWGKVGDDATLNQDALAKARKADAIIAILGLTPWLEGEEMAVKIPGFEGADRTTLDLPRPQEALLGKLAGLGKPLVLVLTGGSALAVNAAAARVPAILASWYPGQAGSEALADVLFGDYAPGGRLPITFYKSAAQLPKLADYSMKERTYRYFSGTPLYPFGYGLSYARFVYSDLRVPETIEAGKPVTISVTVENAGVIDADEVVQVYVRDMEASAPVPLRALKAFVRARIRAGNRYTLEFELAPEDFSLVDSEGKRVVEPGTFEISVGGGQPPMRGVSDVETSGLLRATLTVTGAPLLLSPR